MPAASSSSSTPTASAVGSMADPSYVSLPLQVVRGILSLAAKAMPAASSSTSTASAAGGVAPGGGVFGGSPSLASAFGPPSSGGLGGRSPTFTTNPRALRVSAAALHVLLSDWLQPGLTTMSMCTR
eukprot:732462-Pelagomonas_calceolata.AAC.2